MFILVTGPLHLLFPGPNPTVSFGLQLQCHPHPFTEAGVGCLGSPILWLLGAPSVTAIIVVNSVFRNLLFVPLFLHLPHETELLVGGNHVTIITESLAPRLPATQCS